MKSIPTAPPQDEQQLAKCGEPYTDNTSVTGLNELAKRIYDLAAKKEYDEVQKQLLLMAVNTNLIPNSNPDTCIGNIVLAEHMFIKSKSHDIARDAITLSEKETNGLTLNDIKDTLAYQLSLILCKVFALAGKYEIDIDKMMSNAVDPSYIKHSI